VAADPQLPGLADLGDRLMRLKRAEGELTARYDKVSERLAAFPNEVTAHRYRELGANLAEVESHIEAVEAQLLQVRGRRT
jgi:hypothetical protein